MTTNPQAINPALVLKCARESEPHIPWSIRGHSVFYEYLDDTYMAFDPIVSTHDREALMLVLRDIGWSFGAKNKETGEYGAFRTEYPMKIVKDGSPTLLLLKCASAEWGIELYVEGE